jgi:hypothetical protein
MEVTSYDKRVFEVTPLVQDKQAEISMKVPAGQ